MSPDECGEVDPLTGAICSITFPGHTVHKEERDDGFVIEWVTPGALIIP